MKNLINRLKKFNDWRRGNDPFTFQDLNISPKQIGEDIDSAIVVLENADCLAALNKNSIFVNEDYLYELCDAVVKLERAGYRWCVDFGYANAIKKAKQL